MELFKTMTEVRFHRKMVHGLISIENIDNIKNLTAAKAGKETTGQQGDEYGNLVSNFVSSYYKPVLNKENKYICNFDGCSKVFGTLGKRDWHQQIHLKLFSCNICFKKFGRKRDLKIHERIHFNDKCEECRYCNKKFCDPSSKNRHIRTIHGNGNNNGIKIKKFICVKCYKPFTQKGHLQRHLATHLAREDRELFECDKCPGKTFTTKRNLKRHHVRFHKDG